MFNDFLTALIQKIISFLIANKGFFELTEPDRKTQLEHLKIPHSFKPYFEKVSGTGFMKDIKLILQFLHDPKRTNIKDNAFFKALATFFTYELAKKIDHLDGDFYLLTKSEQATVATKLIPTDSLLAQTLRNLILSFSYQQLVHEIYSLSTRAMKTHLVMVQAPRSINVELKKEIREELAEKYSPSLPIFQINKKLIGGIRIFKDGQNVDHSWLSRVLKFTSLTTV